MIRYDFHMHSSFSGDCATSPYAMAERALALGLDGICFTEHQDIDAPDCGVDFSVDFERYFAAMQKLREDFSGRLLIYIGMEFGIMEHLSEALDQLLAQYPFDFVIASQHFVHNRDPYFPSFFEGKSERECYEEYFLAQLETVKKISAFHTLGHMDYVVRYGPNQNTYYTYEAYADFIDPILRYLIENGKCLEVNTGGFRYGLGEPNPCSGILKRYRELGGELITIGSDGHKPEHLAYDFDRASALLTKLGYQYYTIFDQRKPVQIRL